MLDLLVYLAVLVIIVAVVWWLLAQLGVPEPAGKIIRIVVVVLVALVAINLLLQATGHTGLPMRLR